MNPSPHEEVLFEEELERMRQIFGFEKVAELIRDNGVRRTLEMLRLTECFIETGSTMQ